MARRGLPPPCGIRRIRPVVRSETSASPFGRNAIPHGTCRPVAIVRSRGTFAGVAMALGAAAAVVPALGEGVAAAGGLLEPQAPNATASGSSMLRRITLKD